MTEVCVVDKVTIPGIGRGWVSAVRADDAGNPIVDVLMESPIATPTGYYLARVWELKKGWELAGLPESFSGWERKDL